MSYYGPEDFEDYGPSDELSAKIHELIEVEAKAKIKGTFEALEYERQRVERLEKENRDLRNRVSGFEQEITKQLRDKENEVRRDFFGGWNVGDKIYYPSKKYHEEKCITCNGSRKIVAILPDTREHKVDCPDCNWHGMKIKQIEHFPKEDRINSIKLYKAKDYTIVTLYLDREDRERKLDEVHFKTLEECQAYCNEQNLPKDIESTESA